MKEDPAGGGGNECMSGWKYGVQKKLDNHLDL